MCSRSVSRRSKVIGRRRFGNSIYLQPPISFDTPFVTSSLSSKGQVSGPEHAIARYAAIQGEDGAGGEPNTRQSECEPEREPR